MVMLIVPHKQAAEAMGQAIGYSMVTGTTPREHALIQETARAFCLMSSYARHFGVSHLEELTPVDLVRMCLAVESMARVEQELSKILGPEAVRQSEEEEISELDTDASLSFDGGESFFAKSAWGAPDAELQASNAVTIQDNEGRIFKAIGFRLEDTPDGATRVTLLDLNEIVGSDEEDE